MSHCDVYQGLRFTMTLSRVISHYDVKAMVCYSGRLISVMLHCDVYHGLCYISDIHQWLCHIVIFVKGYVALWCLSRFTFHYDVIEGYITLRR